MAAKTRAARPLREDAEESRPTSRPPERGLPPLQVRYYRRMKRGRSYDYVVSWDQEFKYRGPEQDVVVRLLAGGAQVVPSEVQLDPRDSNDKAYFHVTPLARGWLPGQKVEVIVNGRKVQEIQVASKVVGRRLQWSLLLLTFLLPWFILTYVKGATMELEAAKHVEESIARNVPSTPSFIKDSVPAIHDGLLTVRKGFAQTVETLHLMAWEHPIAFYAGSACFLLFLISLFLRRDKRKTRVGKPLFLPRPGREEDEE